MAIDVNHLAEAAQELGGLTQRERDVLALLREGLASREIAERLALSEATVYRVIAGIGAVIAALSVLVIPDRSRAAVGEPAASTA